MNITYVLGESLYLNITNKCPNNCEFCIRTYSDTVGDADSLWLEREPTLDEIVQDVDRRDLSKYKEVVFCGYGEPLERLNELVNVACHIKSKSNIPIRINTNGLGNLIAGRDITNELTGCIDIVSVSLNASNAEDYDKICKSVYGLDAFNALLNFTELCVGKIPTVVFTVVDTLPAEEIEKCRSIALEIGASFRVRQLY